MFKQLALTFNPCNEKHWLNHRFFQKPHPNSLSLTTNYLCNEFLGDDDRELFEWMKTNSPRRYKIEGLGEWGIAEGSIFDNWTEREFDWREISRRESARSCFGLDFGYTNDPTAFMACLVDPDMREIYIFDEHYERAMTNPMIANMIRYKGFAKERIVADAAEPKSIEEIRLEGIYHITEAQKGKDSILNGIQCVQQYTIIVHPRCTNTIVELSNYVWAKDKEGKTQNKLIDEYNRLMDALRYATEQLMEYDPWTDFLRGEYQQIQTEQQIDEIPKTR